MSDTDHMYVIILFVIIRHLKINEKKKENY